MPDYADFVGFYFVKLETGAVRLECPVKLKDPNQPLVEIDQAAFVLLPIAQILCHAAAPPRKESSLMQCGSKSIPDLFTLTASLNLSNSSPEFSALFFFCNFSVLSHSYVSFRNWALTLRGGPVTRKSKGKSRSSVSGASRRKCLKLQLKLKVLSGARNCWLPLSYDATDASDVIAS